MSAHHVNPPTAACPPDLEPLGSEKGRVALGDYSPRAPTDPDLPN